MKKLIRSSISILLAAFILVSGSGFVIGRMMCMHSGYTVYSLHEAKDCCNDSKGVSIKGSCCAITNAFIKTDKFTAQTKISIPQNFSFVHFSIPTFQIASIQRDTPLSALRSPPLISGADLLHLISIQRI